MINIVETMMPRWMNDKNKRTRNENVRGQNICWWGGRRYPSNLYKKISKKLKEG